MIKRSIIITGLLLIISVYANAQISVGIKIDGGLAYQGIKAPDIIDKGSVKTFSISAITEIPVKYGFWLQAGLGIGGKGSVVYNDALTTNTHLTYIEVPVDILRKFTFTDLGIFYLGAGGYIAKGTVGHLDYQTPGSSNSDYVRFGKDNDFKKFDTGINFLTGFEFRNKLTFNIAYSLGLNNIASLPQQDSGIAVVKNREFSMGLGYLF